MERHIEKEIKRGHIRDVILGSQDGIVNTLGIILAVATATNSIKLVVVSGLAATFAESVSMAAVAYTSSQAAHDFYMRKKKEENQHVDEKPEEEEREIYDIYYKKGFRGKLLSDIVKKITSDRRLWIETMMSDEHRLFPEEYESPIKSSVIVGFAALAGSFIPLLPFLFLPINAGIVLSVIISTATLFAAGAFAAKLTVGSWIKGGAKMALVGMSAAAIGYLIGYVLGAVVA